MLHLTADRTMTDEQIERAVERKMDRLDHRLMIRTLTQREYDEEVRRLDKWAEQEYRFITRR